MFLQHRRHRTIMRQQLLDFMPTGWAFEFHFIILDNHSTKRTTPNAFMSVLPKWRNAHAKRVSSFISHLLVENTTNAMNVKADNGEAIKPTSQIPTRHHTHHMDAQTTEKIGRFEVKQIGPESDRVLEFVGTDETQDRDGDIIKADGWKFENYLKNPVFLPFHNPWTVPAAKCVGISKAPGATGVSFQIKFATIEELCSNPATPSNEALLADTLYNAYKNGFMKAVSIGFIGLEHQENESNKDIPSWQRGRIFTSQEMLELSAVAIPSNPNALVQARAFKGWKNGQMKMLEAIFKDAEEQKPAESGMGLVEAKATLKALLGGVIDLADDKKDGMYQSLKKTLEAHGEKAPDFRAYTASELKVMFEEESEMDATAVQKAIGDAVAPLLAQIEDLKKALDSKVEIKGGAKYSAETKAKIQEMHDHMDKAMAVCKAMISDSGTVGNVGDGVEEPMANTEPDVDDKGIDLSLIDLKKYGIGA